MILVPVNDRQMNLFDVNTTVDFHVLISYPGAHQVPLVYNVRQSYYVITTIHYN